jgi:O-antigen/teichoic acid export membrane protein
LPRLAQLRSRFRALTRLISLESDLSSETGRAAERHRRIALAALSSGLASTTSFVAALVIVPVVLHHLGSERYGVFATITAIAGLVGWADLGIGNGLINEVASAEGRDDRAAVSRAVSSAFFALLSVAVVLALVFAVVYPFVRWPAVFNVGGHAARGVGAAVAAFVAGVLLAMPLAVVQRTEIGMQEGFVASAWQTLGSLVGLAGVIAVVAVGAALPYIVLAVSLAPAIALAGNGLQLFYGRQVWLRPSLRGVDRETVGRLLRTGSLFFVLQIALAVSYEADAIVLTQILGPSAVTTFSVTMRVFLVIPALSGFVLTPLWPAYAEAISRGDAAWVRQTLRRVLKAALLLSLSGAAVLALVARPVIHLWAGLRPPNLLLVAAAIWVVAMTLGAVLAAFLNGARVIRPQITLAVGLMVTNLGLSIVFTRWIGVSGVIWGSIIAQLGWIAIVVTVVVPRALNRLEAIAQQTPPEQHVQKFCG